MLERVLAAGFGQRRKMLRQSLRPLGLDIEALLAAAGAPATARAEELSVEQFCALARAYRELSPPLRSRLTNSARPVCRSRRTRSAARIAWTRRTLASRSLF